MPRGRGGARKGTPGKGYANRTDLTTNMDNTQSAASGGIEAPAGAAPMQLPVYPDQTPNLMDPTQRPDEPITDGLMMGGGRGPEAMTNYDPRVSETAKLKRWLPLLDPLADDPDTPDSVRSLVRYIRSS